MPTFCRHNRFIQNCPICREPEPPASARRAPRRSASSTRTAARTATSGSSAARKPSRPSTGVRVRRVARAADDGYSNELVPGLRATADARRLADELAFSVGRLAELAAAPPGLYGEAVSEPDREEALWLATLIAVVGPLDGDDPFATVRAARVGWASGEIPSLDGAPLGPRGAASDADAQRALTGYRAWAGRAGSQAAALGGEPAWTPERRFARAFERLGTLRGFARGARYDLLVSLGRLGLVEVRADGLHVDGGDPVSLAAKRVFGIADTMLIERRAAELMEACELPMDALDLALFNWGADARSATQGADAAAVDESARASAAQALGVEPEDG